MGGAEEKMKISLRRKKVKWADRAGSALPEMVGEGLDDAGLIGYGEIHGTGQADGVGAAAVGLREVSPGLRSLHGGKLEHGTP